MSTGQHRRISNTDEDIAREYKESPELVTFDTWIKNNRPGMSRFRRERIRKLIGPERGMIPCVGHAHRSQEAYDACGAREARDAEIERIEELLDPDPWKVRFTGER